MFLIKILCSNSIKIFCSNPTYNLKCSVLTSKGFFVIAWGNISKITKVKLFKPCLL